LRFARDSACPQVYGSYDASSPDFAYIMTRQSPRYDTVGGPVESMSLVLENDSLLTVIAWRDRVPSDTVVLRRRYDFDCGDGWMKPHLGTWLPGDDGDSPAARARRSGRRDFRITTGAKGALIGRLDHHTFDQFDVWCGDGCKGFPLPWTWRTSHQWFRAAVVNPQSHRVIPPPRPVTPLDQRLLREEAILEGRIPP